MLEKLHILAVGAHPDDIDIQMFGTLACYKAAGASLTLAVATDGASGGCIDPAVLVATRKREANAAADHLGVTPVLLGFADGGLLPDAALVRRLRELIAEVEPDLVITHPPNDYHSDHRALSDGMRLAVNFAAPVLHCDIWNGTGFVPTHYVDISAHIAEKHAAILCHRSQDPERFIAQVDRQNGFRAGQCNMPEGFAEAFRFEPVYPFADIRDLLPPAPPVRPVVNRAKATPKSV